VHVHIQDLRFVCFIGCASLLKHLEIGIFMVWLDARILTTIYLLKLTEDVLYVRNLIADSWTSLRQFTVKLG